MLVNYGGAGCVIPVRGFWTPRCNVIRLVDAGYTVTWQFRRIGPRTFAYRDTKGQPRQRLGKRPGLIRQRGPLWEVR